MKNANSISAHAIAHCGLFVVSTGLVSSWPGCAMKRRPMRPASSLDPRR